MSNSIWPDGEVTAELLVNVRGGESLAVEQLMDRHRNSLRRMIQLRLDQRLMQRMDVSDVIQDVLMEANRRLTDYLANPVIPFHLWIRQIAKDRIIDAHRRHRVSAKRSIDREQPQPGKGPPDQSTMELANQFRDHALTPAAAATQRELAEQIESAVQLLRENDREIILMRHYEQLNNQEIAQSLGLTEPAASMRYLRALKRLREVIEGLPTLHKDLQE
ncbi:MAG: sigma-70 family RNA polymerase sigma factor [Planctomycetota bacterium]|nr:sigma-70 family RNA polymerase sigma factor [Planctomycetota bacterium]